MPVSVGDKLGPYEILSLLGVGGMGEVYRARDTTLKRDVALKVLPSTFLRDRERMARFQREAEVLASLDHPNIGHIHGIVDSEGSRGLVLALIEGPTLADRIDTGPVPLEEAVAISKQIIEALEYAHDRGVVHRDLKPANIKITSDGVVKVLDFGLAKVLEDEPAPSSLADSPTLTLGHTRTGVILGTAAYMSPEQTVGRPVDRRSDIFSFASVLYEMLTGKRAFTGATTPDVLEAVVKNDPDWSMLPAGTPGYLRRLLKRMLAKDRKQRLQAIGEARIAIQNSGKEPEVLVAMAPTSWLGWLAWTVAALAVACSSGLALVHLREEPPRLIKTSVLPPENAAISSSGIPAVSPDGRRVAFVAASGTKSELWVRDLDSLAVRALPGTDGASLPFWSPDSRLIGFFAEGKLKRIGVAGGSAVTLCDAVRGRGGSWSQNDVIVFALDAGGIFRVPAAGGTATPVTPDRKVSASHRFPWFLPDGRHFLFVAPSTDPEKIAVEAGDLDSTQIKHIANVFSNAVYAPPGYLLFVRDRTLMAQPFDAGKLQTTGDAVLIAEQIASGGFFTQNQFSVSHTGVLVYTSGSGGENVQLTWFDRSGKAAGTVGSPGGMNSGAFSPDGKTVAVDREDSESHLFDVWLHDLARGTESRFTFGPRNNDWPVWSPDGSRIAFRSTRDGLIHAFQKATSGASQDEVLDKPLGSPPQTTRVDDWSRDGRYLIEETTGGGTTSNDIWVVPLSGDRKPIPYLQTQFTESRAKLSPDGRWLAYQSNESKRDEIYVQTFPTPGGKWPVSLNGGTRPVWSRDGKELYFISADAKLMAVQARSTAAEFEAGMPKPLFDVRIRNDFGSRYDVSPDGRFLIPTPVADSAAVPLTVVVNWLAALKK